MAFKYGSATKAVREIPVIKYSKKLGNQQLSGLKYLREGMEGVIGAYRVHMRLEYPGLKDELNDDVDNRPFIHTVS
jgi:hypothetical protein